MELTVPLRKIISIVLIFIGVECIHLLKHLLTLIPALDMFSNILRHIKIVIKSEKQVHIFLLDLVCKTARLCYKYLARARAHTSSGFPCSLYSQDLEKDDSCLPVTRIIHEHDQVSRKTTYPVPLRPRTNDDTEQSMTLFSSGLEG
jgi:hypothetical protein